MKRRTTVGSFFDTKMGSISARIKHTSSRNWLAFQFNLRDSYILTNTERNDWTPDDPVEFAECVVNKTMLISSLWCPFESYLNFLEAITTKVRECAFSWDAEGSDARMEWSTISYTHGMLKIIWHGGHRGILNSFERSIHLNTRQAVGMLYLAFRNFVESPEYDRRRYEGVTTIREEYDFLLRDHGANDLLFTLVELDAFRARALLKTLNFHLYNHIFNKNIPEQKTLRYYMQESLVYCDALTHSDEIPEQWDQWSRQTKIVHLQNEVLNHHGWTWLHKTGKLIELKSALIENWLKSQTLQSAISNFNIIKI